MINVSDTFRNGVNAQSRRVRLKAIVDLRPTNIVFGSVIGSSQSVISKSDQLCDGISKLGSKRSITTELNRWIIGDASFTTYDQLPDIQVGYESLGTFDANGEGNYYVEEQFSGVTLLQSFYIYFPEKQETEDTDYYGFPVDFTLAVMQGENVGWSAQYTDNVLRGLYVTGFTVNNPTGIRITATRWSLPNRRFRIPEISPGTYETWLDDMFASFSMQQKCSFTSFSLPYTTCNVAIDNSDMRFDPTNKQSLFKSLEERQPIEIQMSVNDSNYYSIGKLYQYSNGWKTGNHGLSITWKLVDLIGLLIDRKFDATGLTLPTTFEGWVQAVLKQLGTSFQNLYIITSGLGSTVLTTTEDKVKDQKCGQILQWLCQATQTWVRANADGKLLFGRFENQSQATSDLTFDNLSKYPTLEANDDIASIDYQINDSQKLSYSGTSTSSPNSQSISNPFITSQAAATTSAQYVLQFFGGNKIGTTGRGNPAQELGDIVYVELNKGMNIKARVIEQTFEINDHVLKECKTTLISVEDSLADYNAFEILTSDMDYVVPGNIATDEDNNATMRIVLVGAGATGGHGSRPWAGGAGENGEPGSGGYINIVQNDGEDPIVQPGQILKVTIGLAVAPSSVSSGSTAALPGGHSTIKIGGVTYTSANGTQYADGIVETVSGKMLGRSNQQYPSANSGDGGAYGLGGTSESIYDWEVPPSKGTKAADGCVIVCYKIEEGST